MNFGEGTHSVHNTDFQGAASLARKLNALGKTPQNTHPRGVGPAEVISLRLSDIPGCQKREVMVREVGRNLGDHQGRGGAGGLIGVGCMRRCPGKAWSANGGRGVEVGLGRHRQSSRDPQGRVGACMLPCTWLAFPAEHSNVHTPVLHPGGLQVWSRAELKPKASV